MMMMTSFMMPRNAYHRSRTQSHSGVSAAKDASAACATPAVGSTLHEQMKQYIRCTQSLSGATITEEDSTQPDYDLLPANAARALHPPSFTVGGRDIKQHPRPMSGVSGTTPAASTSTGKVPASASRSAMVAPPGASAVMPPRDMLLARRRQRSYSCSGGGGAGDAHTSMAHATPTGISCCSGEKYGLYGPVDGGSGIYTASTHVTPPSCIIPAFQRPQRAFSSSGGASVHTSSVQTASLLSRLCHVPAATVPDGEVYVGQRASHAL